MTSPHGQAKGGGRRSRVRRPSGRWPACVLAVAWCVCAAACGYHLVGTSSSLPESIRSLCVSPFINRTERNELDQRLAEALTQEWVRRGRFQLVSTPEQADAVLSGTIVQAVSSPVQFDPQGRATEYQLMLVADVQLVDRTGEKPVVLWQDKRFSRNVSYAVDANATDYFDRETEAIERLSRDFARALVVTILEGF